ncbi:MAG: NAD(P)-dependent oxidoreductase [Cypionkella sp.]|uniref:SDR family oxidoreductase n=1 Tax=Cypionkella sp. TaxID=2811411 RepID=UPI002607AFBD|nr:SDR family oxidoreductase [Cypionkella sp.]MDB5657541.1 NAD(P)-dependent oxidoreductase [Cypionkella sp.]MDB5663820.1 NAD(P)-dependent oxidoreductase [Cypionkella sp.]
MQRLSGKRALITAAGQGIGKATALRLAEEGAQVLATDVNAATLEELNGTPGITTQVLNVLDADAITAVVAAAGRIDILFNCAGVVHAGDIMQSSEDEWDFAFALNCKAMYRMLRAVLPGMVAQGGGSIINMASVAGPLTAPPNRFIYSASKAAVGGITKSVAQDYVKQGIRCNAVCPGTVDSPSLHQRLRDTGDYEGAMAAFIARQPMGRIGKPEEIAAMVAYLGADESAYTTGQLLALDGGWTI